MTNPPASLSLSALFVSFASREISETRLNIESRKGVSIFQEYFAVWRFWHFSPDQFVNFKAHNWRLQKIFQEIDVMLEESPLFKCILHMQNSADLLSEFG